MQVQIKSEHAMGYFKGRFCSLRGLHQQINDAVDHERALAWVKACIVIHTLMHLIENGEEDPEFVDELVQEGLMEPGVAISQKAARGQKKRAQLKAYLLSTLVWVAFEIA